MRPHLSFLMATALVFSRFAQGQTSTDYSPLTNTTCPSDPALGKSIFVDFTKGASSEFTADIGTTISYGTDGAEFIMTSDGAAKTIIYANYIFFGKVEIVMRAANGTGVVSSFVMESDDLDEIDWEWLGGNTTVVETNYFGKGNTTTYNRATYESVSTPQETFHTYTIDWTSTSTIWSIDSVAVRTLLYSDALSGANYPQTPMRIKLGIWDGGAADEAEGTVSWAGGHTDLANAPFVMYVKSIRIQDYTTGGTEYSYGDESGAYASIVVSGGNGTVGEGTSSYSSNSTVGTAGSSNVTVTGSIIAASSSAVVVESGVVSGKLVSSFALGVPALGSVCLLM